MSKYLSLLNPRQKFLFAAGCCNEINLLLQHLEVFMVTALDWEIEPKGLGALLYVESVGSL